MKHTENTQTVNMAEYRSCITLLNVYQDALYGCCNNVERQSRCTRALNQLSNAKWLHCHRANSADVQRFESACRCLLQSINRVSPEGQLICAA
ncbi:hypothetical protein AV903_14995 [Erwinia tracheiphila]|uniref:Uncharacterized protein n=1 Tax=Erwinia tracheiphila TaxID=65700 RepID=A0A345CUB4_9GAMM|nr:hypothetical protein AV903_14995 [Erwinia tracheiphila]